MPDSVRVETDRERFIIYAACPFIGIFSTLQTSFV
jgi:hypothetical protein